MDIKTFQYMQTRVRKAQELFRKIDVISEAIKLISDGKAFINLDIESNNGSRDLIRRYSGIENSNGNGDKDNRELYEILRPVLLNEFMDKRKKLQNELEEI